MTAPISKPKPKPYIDFGPQKVYAPGAKPLPVILYQITRYHRGYMETRSMGLVFVADHPSEEAARRHADLLCDTYRGTRRNYEIDYYIEAVTSIPEPEGWLVVSLRDAFGTVVETYEAPASEAIAKASNFMLLHGVDPDERGAAADKGTIHFAPSQPPASAFKHIGHGVKVLKPVY